PRIGHSGLPMRGRDRRRDAPASSRGFSLPVRQNPQPAQTSMLLAFGGSLIVSLLSARAHLEAQLSIKNADNASALALSLSLHNPDRATIELATMTLLDSKHYELIRVDDPEGHPIVERVGGVDHRDAPQWFERWLPIHATPGQAKINNAWQQVGTVTVVSHNHLAYATLWSSVWPTIAAMTFACLVGGSLGAIILGRLKSPLQAVIDQATAIQSIFRRVR
ncbi:MAG TPA: LapD/MoxY N-terminal periplasmic domain-containing protein, partial [Accumulibacter sp.]|nr:LapD/MoxY N-terminal periplasmic domain-containing protein [Accumulibacter sp.]